MCSMNLIYNPDHQQVLEHHKELLKKAEQVQLTCSVMETPKHPMPSLREWLQHWLSIHRSSKIAQVTSQSSSSRT